MPRVSAEIPEKLHIEFKKAVFSQGFTLQKVLSGMISNYVTLNGQKPDSNTLKSSDTADYQQENCSELSCCLAG